MFKADLYPFLQEIGITDEVSAKEGKENLIRMEKEIKFRREEEEQKRKLEEEKRRKKEQKKTKKK